ncbi:hypothetical protein CsSME_00040466 [Camellia sinensis var. sinensis]
MKFWITVNDKGGKNGVASRWNLSRVPFFNCNWTRCCKGSTGLKPYGLGMDNVKGLLLRHRGWNFWESRIKDKIVRTGAAVNAWNWRTLGHVQKQIKNKLYALWSHYDLHLTLGLIEGN